jgi:hypothetical protein
MFALTTQSGRGNQIETEVMEKTVWRRMQSGLRKKHAASDSAEFLCPLLFARKPTRSAQAPAQQPTIFCVPEKIHLLTGIPAASSSPQLSGSILKRFLSIFSALIFAPLLKSLRHDPRYTELLKKLNLPT